MKKLLLATALLVSIGKASELKNLLNDNYNTLFDLELQKSFSESKYNSLSWISPVMLTFQRKWSTQIPDGTHPFNSYSISINQPIFKSGGIYYGIKFAKSNYNLGKANTIKQKNALIAKAVELLFKIKQTKLTIAKLKTQIANSKIEIKSRDELYNAGVSDSVDLDRALAKRDEAEIAMLDMQANLEELKGAFAKISNKNPNRLRVPKLRMVSKSQYIGSNVDIDVANASARAQDYATKMVRSKYLPTVSVGASYTKVSKAQPLTHDKFANYSLTVSMPLSVNVGNDLETAKLKSMIAKVKAKTTRKDSEQDYKTINKKIAIINRRIALANREARTYKRLLKSTRNLYKAGQKSINDVKILKNSLKMKRLDAQIFSVQKQLELLKLYAKMR